MGQRLSRWGIGPKIAAPSFTYTSAVLAASFRWPSVFMLDLPEAVRIVGAVLTALGLALWFSGAAAVMRGYNRDQLVTSGPCAIVRHPIYAGWISLALPGLALLVGAWPLFVTPFLAYGIFKRLIHEEDQYLELRFGQAYRDYRARVNEIIPIPRFWPKRTQTNAAKGGK